TRLVVMQGVQGSRLPELTSQVLTNEYVTQRKAPYRIARDYGTTYASVVKRLLHYGIELRKKRFIYIGDSFGRLTVTRKGRPTPTGQSRWWCKCICGNVLMVKAIRLKYGDTKSCGCLQKDRAREAATGVRRSGVGFVDCVPHTYWLYVRKGAKR